MHRGDASNLRLCNDRSCLHFPTFLGKLDIFSKRDGSMVAAVVPEVNASLL